MSWGFVAVAGATVVSGALSANAQKKAGQTTARSSDEAVAEQQRQFDEMKALLQPYSEAGEGALNAQQALLGLSGQEAQQQAISQLEAGPQFQALQQQGENALLQNAAATGGLRGGNLQSALAQYRPQLLSNLIQQQYQNLGGIAQLGQAAAAGQASAGLQTGANVGNILTQAGANQANLQLAQGQTQSDLIGELSGLAQKRFF